MARRILTGLVVAASLLGLAALARADELPPFKTLADAAPFAVEHGVFACPGTPGEPMDRYVLLFAGRYYVLMAKPGRWVLVRISEEGARERTTDPDYVWFGATPEADEGQPADSFRVVRSMTGREAMAYSSGPCTWLDIGRTT